MDSSELLGKREEQRIPKWLHAINRGQSDLFLKKLLAASAGNINLKFILLRRRANPENVVVNLPLQTSS